MNDDRHVRDSLAHVKTSIEIADEILRLCYLSLDREDDLSSQLETLLHDFSIHLRTSLNVYSKAVFAAEDVDKTAQTHSEFRYDNVDFPLAQNKSLFDQKPAIRAVKEVSEDLYNAYERLQPYYAENEWLAHLMRLSHQDQEETVRRVDFVNTADLTGAVQGEQNPEIPAFEGDQLRMPSSSGIITTKLPFYFAPLHAFATREHTWSKFLFSIREKSDLDLIDFVQTTPSMIVRILSTLDPQFGGAFAALFKDEVENNSQ